MSFAIVNVLTGKTEARIGDKLGVSDDSVTYGTAWSPTGNRLAFRSDRKWIYQATRLRIYDLRTKSILPISLDVSDRDVTFHGASGDGVQLDDAGTGWDWSPDGRRIAAVQPDRKHPYRLRLAVADVVRSKVWLLPQTLATKQAFAFWGSDRPAGRLILPGFTISSLTTLWAFSHDSRYVSYYALPSGGSFPRLVIADLRRHTVRAVANSFEAAWSPVEDTLAVVASTTQGCRVQLIAAVTGKKTTVPLRIGNCGSPIVWTRDGTQFAVTASTAATSQIYTVNRATSTARAVSEARPDEVTWPSDCTTLFRYGQGWIINDFTGVPRFIRQPPYVEVDNSFSLWRLWRC